MSQSTAIQLVAQTAGTSEEEITEVLRGMIISSKNQHGSVATNAELAVVAGTCAKYGLNPLTKEAHAFVSGGKLQLIVGVDGWAKIMLRQPDYDGIEFEDHIDSNGKLTAITTKIFSKNRTRPTTATEYMDECNDTKSPVWRKFPRRMLRHKSMIQCCRIAFGISEVIDDDEKNRIIDNSPKVSKPVQSVDFEEMERSMAECGDIDSLQELCVTIRTELEKGNAWESSKAKCAAMKIQHKNRIEAMVDDIEDAEFFEGEIGEIQDEVLNDVVDAISNNEEQDISFE